jgi:hypothetical protein
VAAAEALEGDPQRTLAVEPDGVDGDVRQVVRRQPERLLRPRSGQDGQSGGPEAGREGGRGLPGGVVLAHRAQGQAAVGRAEEGRPQEDGGAPEAEQGEQHGRRRRRWAAQALADRAGGHQGGRTGGEADERPEEQQVPGLADMQQGVDQQGRTGPEAQEPGLGRRRAPGPAHPGQEEDGERQEGQVEAHRRHLRQVGQVPADRRQADHQDGGQLADQRGQAAGSGEVRHRAAGEQEQGDGPEQAEGGEQEQPRQQAARAGPERSPPAVPCRRPEPRCVRSRQVAGPPGGVKPEGQQQQDGGLAHAAGESEHGGGAGGRPRAPLLGGPPEQGDDAQRERAFESVGQGDGAVVPGEGGGEVEQRPGDGDALAEHRPSGDITEHDGGGAGDDADRAERRLGVPRQGEQQASGADVEDRPGGMWLVAGDVEVDQREGVLHRIPAGQVGPEGRRARRQGDEEQDAGPQEPAQALAEGETRAEERCHRRPGRAARRAAARPFMPQTHAPSAGVAMHEVCHNTRRTGPFRSEQAHRAAPRPRPKERCGGQMSVRGRGHHIWGLASAARCM